MTYPNEPAFPIACPIDFQFAEPGLTKREYFAAMAMQGLLATHRELQHNEINVAYWAAKNADALIAELAKAEPEDVAAQDAEIERLKVALGEYVCDCKGQCQAEIYGGSCGRMAYAALKGGEA